ncbi:DUF4331 domain-containing protein [Actinomadura sp. KC345]|uniref:DUF4331 family protein n=1 Tax=Actinomadura sp. KC345 TaxID=2530371 RepID=UPI00104E8D6B|nr:DUF4331 family protein [Actinomadura sp. KC345]TDC52519.1 DUF4331 domain-containing protein [Actinomadura sp. KC345]
MSHHLDSPLARQDPRLDISDVYVFRGTAGTVFIMNVNPLSGSGGFHPEGRYEFRIDTDGDAVEDLTYCAEFGERGGDGRQSLVLRRCGGAAARDRGAAGTEVARGQTGEAITGTDGVLLWAGPAADPFCINGAVVGAVKGAVTDGRPFDPGDVLQGENANLFAGTNVSAIVLEVPDGNFDVSAIGFWGTTALATDAGGWRQINRCAHPLVNTLFHPDDSQLASDYNTTQPSEDRKLYGPRVHTLVARAVTAMRTTHSPDAYAEQVVETIFPDVLRYEIGTHANFGFATHNGRGLLECAPEVMFALVLNKAVPLGLDSGSAINAADSGFPYLAPPL